MEVPAHSWSWHLPVPDQGPAHRARRCGAEWEAAEALLGEEESPEREAGGGATRPQPMGCRGGRGRST